MKNKFGVMFVIFVAAWASGVHADGDDLSRANHPFEKVEIDYRTGELCSFQYSPIQFCDERHVAEMIKAIETRRPNFNHYYILVTIDERKKYFEHSVVAIDSRTGVVYPLPFDSYSGNVDAKGNVHDYGHISYTFSSNRVCITGAIVAYRQIDSGKLCWDFDGTKFVGHHTPYMD